MPDTLRPASALTRGRKNWLWVPTIAATTLIPTVAEMTAGTVFDISRVLFGDSGQPDQTTERNTADARWGDERTYERLGGQNITGGDLLFPVNPQAPTGDAEKKAWEMWQFGALGNLVRRLNIPRATAPAALQWIEVFKAEVAPGFIVERPQGQGGEVGAKAAFGVIEYSGLVQIPAA